MTSDATSLADTALRPGQLLPDVSLTDARTGAPWRPSALRQRAAQLLCFVHDACPECEQAVADLADRQDDLRWMDTQARIVLEQPAVDEPAERPFPVALDPDGRARSRILGPASLVPALVVVDRFTAVVEIHPAPDHDFPDPDEVVTALRLLACDCE